MNGRLSRQTGWIIGCAVILIAFQALASPGEAESDIFYRAMELRAQGDLNGAYQLFEQSVEKGVRVHDAYWEMGMILLDRGAGYRVMRRALSLSPRIIEAFQERLAEHPDDDWSWFRLAFIHEMRSEAPGISEWGEARDAILRALEISPENSFYWLHLGYIYYKMEQYEEAVSPLIRALELDPGYWEVRYYLALSYLELGESGLARRELKMITDNISRQDELYGRAERELKKLGD